MKHQGVESVAYGVSLYRLTQNWYNVTEEHEVD